MMRRGQLRSKTRKIDPRVKLYKKEVLTRRKAEGKMNEYDWQPHHLDPPHKKRLLFFALIHRTLHDRITASPNWARANGWRTHINGELSPMLPEVTYALEREKELMKQLENPKLSGA